jgi:hypothetical protein
MLRFNIPQLGKKFLFISFYSTSVLFPKFVDLVPKKSKRCKFCKKYIVQAQDVSKNQGQKLELCHLFLNQLPYCYIFRIDSSTCTILLKFVIFEFKETKISFEECLDSPYKVNLPTGVYELSEIMGNNLDVKSYQKEFIFSKTDRCIILNFRWENISDIFENTKKIRFKIKAEYIRLEAKNIEYLMEIKFKI